MRRNKAWGWDIDARTRHNSHKLTHTTSSTMAGRRKRQTKETATRNENRAGKRNRADDAETKDADQSSTEPAKKIPCKYGAKCYQKNIQHRLKYTHAENPVVDKAEQQDKQKDIETSEPAEIKDTKEAESKEEEEITSPPPSSPENVEESIKQKFLVDMPEDFYKFWEFCQSLNSSSPETALQNLLGFMLVGPYDVLAGKLKNKDVKNMEDILCHWRYYYDPPEFLTVMKKDDKSLYHVGYYRDFPKEDPVFVGSNAAAKDCTIKVTGENIFGAVDYELIACIKAAKGKKKDDLQSFQEKLRKFAKKHGFSLESKTKRVAKDKSRKLASKTFHKGGIVVPVQGDVGYRPLYVTEGELKNMLKKIDESKTDEERNKNFDALQEIITNIQFANDECDYSMGYELGIDLFSYGSEKLHSTILFLLPLAYELLDRPEYAHIIRAHLSRRKKGGDLSVVCR